jgi:hypothetical protein
MNIAHGLPLNGRALPRNLLRLAQQNYWSARRARMLSLSKYPIHKIIPTSAGSPPAVPSNRCMISPSSPVSLGGSTHEGLVRFQGSSASQLKVRPDGSRIAVSGRIPLPPPVSSLAHLDLSKILSLGSSPWVGVELGECSSAPLGGFGGLVHPDPGAGAARLSQVRGHYAYKICSCCRRHFVKRLHHNPGVDRRGCCWWCCRSRRSGPNRCGCWCDGGRGDDPDARVGRQLAGMHHGQNAKTD